MCIPYCTYERHGWLEGCIPSPASSPRAKTSSAITVSSDPGRCLVSRKTDGEFPGRPVVRAWHFHSFTVVACVQSLLRELRSCKSCDTAKKKRERKEKLTDFSNS